MTKYCIQQDLFGRLLLARTQIIVKGKIQGNTPKSFQRVLISRCMYSLSMMIATSNSLCFYRFSPHCDKPHIWAVPSSGIKILKRQGACISSNLDCISSVFSPNRGHAPPAPLASCRSYCESDCAPRCLRPVPCPKVALHKAGKQHSVCSMSASEAPVYLESPIAERPPSKDSYRQ